MEWFLDTIRQEFGTEIHARAQSLWNNMPTINSLPVDILAHVLSFVDRRDIFRVIRVNKKWHSASKKPAFWKLHIRRTLINAFAKVEERYKLCLTKHMQKHIIETFNPFVFTEYHDRPDLFLKWCCWDRPCYSRGFYIQFSNVEDISVRYVANMTKDMRLRVAFSFDFYLNRCVVESIEYTNRKEEEVPKDHGLMVTRHIGGHGNVRKIRHVFVEGVCQKTTGTYITSAGHTFDGDFLTNTEIPHGGGRWLFADGTTLTGDKVAFDGVPHGKGQEGESEWFAGQPYKKIKL